MGLNAVKYRDEMLFENDRIDLDTPGTMGEYKELRADALEADTLDITVLSESGTIRYFDKNEKVEFFRSGSRVGTYHLQSVTRVGPKLYTLSALSAVGLLIVRPHRGSIYTGQTVAEVVAEICGDIPILIETVYRNIKLYGWLPIASARDNLRQVLFAIGAWLHTDENGTLRVQKLWDGTASVIDFNSVDSRNIHVKHLDPVSAVAVTEHQYIAGTEDVTLFEGTAQQGDVIEFDEPAHTLTAEGFTILESGANYAVLSAGTGKLTGKSYIHNRRVVTRTVTEGVAENVEPITDATLVSLVNSSAVAQRMAAYYACREQLTVDVNPAAEHAGHVVSLWNEWDKQQTLACIASRETKISGLLKSRTSALVGFLPPQPESSEYFDERVLLTGSGEWTVPEGVTELRVVVIGKGQDGTDGSSGTSSSSNGFGQTNTDQASWQPTASDNARSISASASVTAGAAGKGGAGGVGGDGGKVLEASIQVTPDQKFTYAATDTESTFGALTSANGTASDTGFYDVVTQQFFARKGADGQNGADGGSDGKDGGSVGTASGGAGRTGGSSTDTKQNTSNSWLNAKLTLAWTLSGAGGGGAGGGSGDAVGTRGGDASYVYPDADGAVGRKTSLSIYNSSGFSFAAHGDGYVYATRGGNGGDGANGIDGENYGDGGAGGGGGGGAGKVGAASARCTLEGTAPYIHGDKPYQNLYVKAMVTGGGTANGGSAGTGGSGKTGCIIIYYRKKKDLQSGPLVTSNNLGLLDSLGRRMIV